MQTSANYGLKLFEGTDNVKRQDFVDNFQKIDTTMKSIYDSKIPLYKITSATDFNTLTSSGIYYIKVTGCINTPTSNWGTLYVSNEGTMFQIFICDNAVTIYKRIYSNSAWASWFKIADNLANYLALTGGTLTGSLTGTSITATSGLNGSLNGNAATATKLATARTISLAGDVTGSASFDGSGNPTITSVVADDSHNHTSISRINLQDQTLDINSLNLSDWTQSKYYVEKTSGGAANITNIPVAGAAFLLDVVSIRYVSSSDYITKQTFVSVGDSKTYERFCTNGTWGSWSAVYTTANKPTFSDIGAAAASHTHTKSQITDMPTSLPANGGNADTVDSKHASDFHQVYRGLITDFDSALTQGEYEFNSSTINGPISGRYGKVVTVVSTGSTYNGLSNWIWQIAYLTDEDGIFLRRRINNGGWSSWHEMATKDSIPSVSENTDGITFFNSWGKSTHVYCTRIGNTVTLSGSLTVGALNNGYQIMNIPGGYRPSMNAWGMVIFTDSNGVGTGIGYIRLNDAGNAYIEGFSNTNQSYAQFFITYRAL